MVGITVNHCNNALPDRNDRRWDTEVGPLRYVFSAHHDHSDDPNLDYGVSFSVRISGGVHPEHVYNSFDTTLPRPTFYALVARLQREVEAMQADERSRDLDRDVERADAEFQAAHSPSPVPGECCIKAHIHATPPWTCRCACHVTQHLVRATDEILG